jgi:hypothetical protein
MEQMSAEEEIFLYMMSYTLVLLPTIDTNPSRSISIREVLYHTKSKNIFIDC